MSHVDPNARKDADDSSFNLLLESDEQIAEFWEQYYPRIRLAIREKVRAIRRPEFNESEVALSALNSFINRARNGSFPRVADDSELWKLLKTIAIRKVNDGRKRLYAAKRGGKDRLTIGQSDAQQVTDDGQWALDAAHGPHAKPQAELEISDLFRSLLNELGSDRERDVVLLRLQGASFPTIAEALQVSTKTVQRTLSRIESNWTETFLKS